MDSVVSGVGIAYAPAAAACWAAVTLTSRRNVARQLWSLDFAYYVLRRSRCEGAARAATRSRAAARDAFRGATEKYYVHTLATESPMQEVIRHRRTPSASWAV